MDAQLTGKRDSDIGRLDRGNGKPLSNMVKPHKRPVRGKAVPLADAPGMTGLTASGAKPPWMDGFPPAPSVYRGGAQWQFVGRFGSTLPPSPLRDTRGHELRVSISYSMDYLRQSKHGTASK